MIAQVGPERGVVLHHSGGFFTTVTSGRMWGDVGGGMWVGCWFQSVTLTHSHVRRRSQKKLGLFLFDNFVCATLSRFGRQRCACCVMSVALSQHNRERPSPLRPTKTTVPHFATLSAANAFHFPPSPNIYIYIDKDTADMPVPSRPRKC